MCFAARQHTGGTSVSPLLFRRPRTMACTPRCHSAIVRCPHDRQRDSSGFGVSLEAVSVWELLLPFANVLGCPCFHALVGLEWNVCPRIFPRHLTSAGRGAFTLFVLFSGQSAEIPGGPVHYIISWLTSISPVLPGTHSVLPVSWSYSSLSPEPRRRAYIQP